MNLGRCLHNCEVQEDTNFSADHLLLPPSTTITSSNVNDSSPSSSSAEVVIECRSCQKGGRLSIFGYNQSLSHSEHLPKSSSSSAMVSIMPMIDGCCVGGGGDDCSNWSSDLDDSASTVKMSNRRQWRHGRHSSSSSHHQDYARRRMTEASRWESFPKPSNGSRRGRLAPPRRPNHTPPRGSSGSTCSSLSSQSNSNSNGSIITAPPPLLTMTSALFRQESQGCLAPRVPKRKSSLDVIKRPSEAEVILGLARAAPVSMRRHTSDRHESQSSVSSRLDKQLSNSNLGHKALRLPTRQPSFQT